MMPRVNIRPALGPADLVQVDLQLERVRLLLLDLDADPRRLAVWPPWW